MSRGKYRAIRRIGHEAGDAYAFGLLAGEGPALSVERYTESHWRRHVPEVYAWGCQCSASNFSGGCLPCTSPSTLNDTRLSDILVVLEKNRLIHGWLWVVTTKAPFGQGASKDIPMPGHDVMGIAEPQPYAPQGKKGASPDRHPCTAGCARHNEQDEGSFDTNKQSLKLK